MTPKKTATPAITVKEARKLLGAEAAHMTNEELEHMIAEAEQMLRFVFRQYMVHKDEMVS